MPLQFNERQVISAFFALLLIALLFIYWPVIIGQKLVFYDDHALIPAIEKIHNFAEYQEQYQQKKILDRQPVRDLSYWIDSQTSLFVGFKTYHLMNVLYWWVMLIGLYLILNTSRIQLIIAMSVVMLTAFHPVAMASVAWAASRKHILSGLFIVWATYFWLTICVKKERGDNLSDERSTLLYKVAILILFLMAAFSQPINIGWPAWVVFTIFLESNRRKINFFKNNVALRENIIFILILFTIALYAIDENTKYYNSEEFVDQFGDKYIQGYALKERLLIYGRSFAQLLLPFYPAPQPWHLNHYFAFVGLALIPFFIYFVNNAKELYSLVLWGSFSLMPMLVITARPIVQGGWDTYLLTPLFGWSLFIANIANRLNRSFRIQSKYILLSAFLFSLFGISVIRHHIFDYLSDDSLRRWLAESEGSNYYRLDFIRSNLIKHPENAHESYELVLPFILDKSDDANIPFLFTRSVFSHPKFTDKEKEEKLLKYPLKSMWWFYHRAALKARHGDFIDAFKIVSLGWYDVGKTSRYDVQKAAPVMAAKWFKMCSLAKQQAPFYKYEWPLKGFEKFEDCKIIPDLMKAAIRRPDWDENEFEKEISEIK